MIWNMKKSGHIYRCPDKYAKKYNKTFTKKKRVVQTAKNNTIGIASRIFNRTLQTMWKTKLQMRKRKGAWTALLSFHKRIWQKPYYDLRAYRIQKISRRKFKQPQKNSENYRKNMRYKSQAFDKKSTFLENKLWIIEWSRPP